MHHHPSIHTHTHRGNSFHIIHLRTTLAETKLITMRKAEPQYNVFWKQNVRSGYFYIKNFAEKKKCFVFSPYSSCLQQLTLTTTNTTVEVVLCMILRQNIKLTYSPPLFFFLPQFFTLGLSFLAATFGWLRRSLVWHVTMEINLPYRIHLDFVCYSHITILKWRKC